MEKHKFLFLKNLTLQLKVFFHLEVSTRSPRSLKSKETNGKKQITNGKKTSIFVTWNMRGS